MGDYIGRENAIKVINQGRLTKLIDADVAESGLKALSAADVVPVVRCRECIHHHYESTDIPYCDRIDYGYGWKDNDFCSRGERKR